MAVFGAVLRSIRLERGLTQEELAVLSGFHRTYISLVERGLKSPSVRAVVRFSDALRVRPSTLFLRFEELLGSKLKTAK